MTVKNHMTDNLPPRDSVKLKRALAAAVDWLDQFDRDLPVWEEWPARDVISLFWEAGFINRDNSIRDENS